MRIGIAKLQIGKSGLTEGFINGLNLVSKTHKQIRISVLKSAGREKEKIIETAEKIVDKMERKASYKVIGFTIILYAKGAKKQDL